MPGVLITSLSIHIHSTIIMMTSSNGNIFRVTGPLCGEFNGHRWIPPQDHWHGALRFSLICVWINSWINNREAGDLRRYRAHYDVIVMLTRAAFHNPRSFKIRVYSFHVNLKSGLHLLSHLPLDKMAAISQTTFSNAFSWMKSFVFDSNSTELCS